MRYLIGIDEAGRGPLAGPVSVGAVIVPINFDFVSLKGARDSKKMTESAREEMYERMRELRLAGKIDFAVSFSSASIIDRSGIVIAIRSALSRCLTKIEADPNLCEVRLDGSLFAPREFVDQKTIIRGDDLEPVISLASIAAKVERDRSMIRLSKRYPLYGLDIHKGYGTSLHRNMIRTHGLSDQHRASFCTRILETGAGRKEAPSLQMAGISV